MLKIRSIVDVQISFYQLPSAISLEAARKLEHVKTELNIHLRNFDNSEQKT